MVTGFACQTPCFKACQMLVFNDPCCGCDPLRQFSCGGFCQQCDWIPRKDEVASGQAFAFECNKFGMSDGKGLHSEKTSETVAHEPRHQPHADVQLKPRPILLPSVGRLGGGDAARREERRQTRQGRHERSSVPSLGAASFAPGDDGGWHRGWSRGWASCNLSAVFHTLSRARFI